LRAYSVDLLWCSDLHGGNLFEFPQYFSPVFCKAVKTSSMYENFSILPVNRFSIIFDISNDEVFNRHERMISPCSFPQSYDQAGAIIDPFDPGQPIPDLSIFQSESASGTVNIGREQLYI